MRTYVVNLFARTIPFVDERLDDLDAVKIPALRILERPNSERWDLAGFRIWQIATHRNATLVSLLDPILVVHEIGWMVRPANPEATR